MADARTVVNDPRSLAARVAPVEEIRNDFQEVRFDGPLALVVTGEDTTEFLISGTLSELEEAAYRISTAVSNFARFGG